MLSRDAAFADESHIPKTGSHGGVDDFGQVDEHLIPSLDEEQKASLLQPHSDDSRVKSANRNAVPFDW